MSLYSEPTPRKAQLTGVEQKAVLYAALEQLHPFIFENVPLPNDTYTVAQHLELAIYDSIKDSYAVDAIPSLFQAMAEAALAKIIEISATRDEPFTPSG